MTLRSAKHWVFDMDGTLTLAVHDFEAIKRALDIPLEDDILGHLAALSAATTINVAPNRVSGRVVKTVTGSVRPSISNATSAPCERPIQLRCIDKTFDGQFPSRVSRSSRRRSA